MLNSLQAVLAENAPLMPGTGPAVLDTDPDTELEAAAKRLVQSYAASGITPDLPATEAAEYACLAMNAKVDSADPDSELADPLLSDLLSTLTAIKTELDQIAGGQS